MYELKNNDLTISLAAIGGELTSIRRNSDQKEFLWQGDPNYWSGQAPVLFPVVGELKNGQYTHAGKPYSLPRHGFARRNDQYSTAQISKTEVAFTLRHSAATLKVYPFKFEFITNYKLVDNQIIITHTVINKDQSTMFFSLGGHPAFNCPLEASESYDSYYLEFTPTTEAQSYTLTALGLLTGQTKTVFEESRIQLTPHIFDEDALVFKSIQSKEISLVHQQKGKILSLIPNDFPDLGIWAKPGAPFVCIEPWLGYADTIDASGELAEKEGIQKLESGQSRAFSYEICIH